MNVQWLIRKHEFNSVQKSQNIFTFFLWRAEGYRSNDSEEYFQDSYFYPYVLLYKEGN